MPEYIECEALKEDIKNHFKKLIDEGYVYDEIFESNAEISRIIDEQPTADVVEVVRCKECAYHNTSPCPMRLSLGFTNNNNFCSYGERRE